MNKVVILAAALLVFFLLLASFWVPWEGAWADDLASGFLSRKFGIRIQCRQARIRHWTDLSFRSIIITSDNARPFVSSGPGQISLGSFRSSKGPLSEIRVELHQVSLAKDFSSKIPVLSAFLTDAREEAVSLDTLKLSLLERKAFLTIHVLKCESKGLQVKVGAQYLSQRKITKAHAAVSLSRPLLERLPLAAQARLVGSSQTWGQLRFVFCKQTLAVFGGGKPLLKAQWH